MDTVTNDLLLLRDMRRARVPALLRACRALGTWARSGANPFDAYRAACRAFTNL